MNFCHSYEMQTNEIRYKCMISDIKGTIEAD